MAGFSGESADFATSTQWRLANYGAFCVFVDMRGRGDSTGTEDYGGREIYDIVDMINYIVANAGSLIDSSQIYIVGYSGGGGNVLSCLARFPDLFNGGVDFFGISDYGHDAVDGWYNNGAVAGDQAKLDAACGGNPVAAPDAYYARANVEAITNYTNGHLWLYHDEDDTDVPVVNTTNVTAALIGAGLANYEDSITTVLDNPRWEHGLPNEPTDLDEAESNFMVAIAAKTYAAWTVPTTDTITVIGYIVTKRFVIWLGTTTEGGGGGGLDEVATVVYDTTSGEYTVTPLTGACDVFVRQGALTATASGIVAETLLTVS